MSEWTAGYVADIGYTFGYYAELNPMRVKLAFLNAGLKPPSDGTACELGFGQGMSANIHAAASVIKWFGTDFNPSQAGFAQELAAVSESGVKLYDDAFADFSKRPDLPDFDYIGLHGIWSWISDENRGAIVDFIRWKLKVGGVLYISYNTQPGWASMLTIRDLLTEHSEVMGVAGEGIISRIDGALDFAEKLFTTDPTYAKANPNVVNKLKTMKGQGRNYLAHEYFNRDWLPMSFSRMSKWLAPAKITYACPAHYLDHIGTLNLSDKQRTFLNEIPDAMFRETVRDIMVNQTFRRDYWVKGVRRLNPTDQIEIMRAQKVILIRPLADVSLKVTGAMGEASMHGAVYTPILEALADHKPKTIGQIEQAVKDIGITFGQVSEAVLLLVGAGSLAALQDEAVVSETIKHTDKLNAHLIGKAHGSDDFSWMASPVTGGGISVNRFQQLFILAMHQGMKQPVEWAQFVWQLLAAQGQRLVQEGKKLETQEENIAELTIQAETFADKQLTILKALRIV